MKPVSWWGPLSSRQALLTIICLGSFAAILAHRWIKGVPDSEYVHRLVSYEFGFLRRALVGHLYSLAYGKIPEHVVFLEGLITILPAAVLLFLILQRSIRPSPAKASIILLIMGSPLLFKNFIGNLGKFDVMGAFVAMTAVVMPVRMAAIVALGALSCLLILVHHLHATIYIPAIYGIVAIRLVAAKRANALPSLLVHAACLSGVVLVFLFATFWGKPSLLRSEFMTWIASKSLRSFPELHVDMWYSTIYQELSRSLGMVWPQALRLPLYAAFVLIHLPLIGVLIGSLPPRGEHLLARRLTALVLIAVAAGYVITNVITFDYARHLGNLAMCALLIGLTLIRETEGMLEVPEDILARPWNVSAAALIAGIPWIGTVFPLF